MRGRKPNPTALKIAQGNPGKRKLNMHEPRPEAGAPCPDHLDGLARERWEQVVPELERLGIITRVDIPAMTRYCEAWALWRKAMSTVAEQGEVIPTIKGNLIQNPWLGIANKQAEIMRRLEGEFGLTPSSRSRFSTPPAPGGPADELADFITGDAGAKDKNSCGHTNFERGTK